MRDWLTIFSLKGEFIRKQDFRKRNWVTFMIVNISELEKGNGELYMVHGNVNIPIWYIL